jgi:SHS2 domain-containing protein
MRKVEKSEKMITKKFEFLDISTADIAAAAYGRTLNKVFANAALAMFEIMTDTKLVASTKEKKLEVRGHDLKSLMFNWLSELIFVSDSENMAFSKFEVVVDEKAFALTAKCAGEKMDPSKHELRTAVKAVTYHKMEIKKLGGMWKAQIIFDV